jgi:hypothetical protein
MPWNILRIITSKFKAMPAAADDDNMPLQVVELTSRPAATGNNIQKENRFTHSFGSRS